MKNKRRIKNKNLKKTFHKKLYKPENSYKMEKYFLKLIKNSETY